MFHEVASEDRDQIAVLVGALCLKTKKAIQKAYPHLQGTDLRDWFRLYVQWIMIKECFDKETIDE